MAATAILGGIRGAVAATGIIRIPIVGIAIIGPAAKIAARKPKTGRGPAGTARADAIAPGTLIAGTGAEKDDPYIAAAFADPAIMNCCPADPAILRIDARAPDRSIV